MAKTNRRKRHRLLALFAAGAVGLVVVLIVAVVIVVLRRPESPPTAVPPTAVPPTLDPKIIGPMEALAKKHFPGVPLLPTMSTEATDGVFLEAIGMTGDKLSAFEDEVRSRLLLVRFFSPF